MKRYNYNWWRILEFLIVIGIGLIIGYFVFKPNKEYIKEIEIQKQEIIGQSLIDSVYTEIFNLRIDHPEVVFAQAMLESNRCKSLVFKENNNLFGMKVAGNRPTTALGIKNGHAYYSSWKESVIDYALYQSSYQRNLSLDEYYRALSRSYAEDPEYIDKLKKLK